MIKQTILGFWVATSLLASAHAHAQINGADLGFSVRGHVKLAQEKPVLIFKPTVHVAALKAECKRSDGQQVSIAIGAMRAGSEKRVVVPQGKGVFKYQCKLDGKANNIAFKDFELEFDTAVGDVPKLLITADDVDESKRQLTLRLTEAAGKVELDVMGDDGKPIDNVTVKYNGEPAGTPLVIKWTQAEGQVMSRFSLRAYEPAGYWNGLEAVTFIDIPHEDVVFESGKWDLLPTEEPKLQAPLDRINTELKRVAGYLQVNLYIGGYTDTVGKPEDNDELSKKRASSIAAWFAKKGITAGILAQGFGERVLKVQTPDNTDELKNRRASYVLGTQPPPANRGFPTRNWHRVK